MSYIKELLDGNIEQFKNNLESALYAKLASQLGEVKKDVAANIYNEGKCVPCNQKINEAASLEDAQIACDDEKDKCIAEWESMDKDEQREFHNFKQNCINKHEKCYQEAKKRFNNSKEK